MDYKDAEAYCKSWADKNGVQLVRYGTCGFGRHCSGFSQRGTWLAYHPRKAEYELGAINPYTYSEIPEFSKVHLNAPSGVEAYHKDNFFCVLHGDGAIDPEEFGKIVSAFSEKKDAEDVIIEIPDSQKPTTPQMEEAVIQLCIWLQDMERKASEINSELFVGQFNNGYNGLQAMLNGIWNPAIGVR